MTFIKIYKKVGENWEWINKPTPTTSQHRINSSEIKEEEEK